MPARARRGRRLGYLAELFRFPGWMTADELLELHQRLAGSRGGEQRARRVCSSSSACRRRVGVRSKRCRRGCSSGSGSRRRSSARRGYCCSTSRRARSTRSAGEPCASSSKNCSGAVFPSCSNSHLLSEIELVCDRVVILLGGRGRVAQERLSELARPRGVEIETSTEASAPIRMQAATTSRV